jgi:prepilin signal peptidase PulO-like enzyme (type II secretory pathway)
MPIWFFTIFAGLLGAVVASFGQCVVTRTLQGGSWITGRSTCDYCGHQLRWYENIPIFSYFLQGGKSRCCCKRLSSFYVVNETIAAALCSLLAWWLMLPIT